MNTTSTYASLQPVRHVALRVRLALLLAALLLSGSLSACLKTFSLTLKPKPDGSGTLDYTVVLKHETLQMMKEAQTESTEKKDQSLGSGLEFQSRQAADSSGGMVSFEQIRYIIEAGDTVGATTTYHFSDLSRLKPQEIFRTKQSVNTEDDSSAEMWDRFEFIKGDPATIKIYSRHPEKLADFSTAFSMPADDGSKKKKSKSSKAPENPFAEMIANALDSLHMNLVIEPQGQILSTNAARREGGTIHFAHVDLSGLTALVKAKTKNPKLAAKLEKEIKERSWAEKTPVVEIRFSK